MGDHVSCNAPFSPPQDYSIDKADIETITQVFQFISNCAVFKLISSFFMPNRKKTRTLFNGSKEQHVSATGRLQMCRIIRHHSVYNNQLCLVRPVCVTSPLSRLCPKNINNLGLQLLSLFTTVEPTYYVITTLPFIPALNRPPVTEEPSHSAPSTTLSSIQEPISSWWDAPLLMIGTPLPQQSTTLSQQPMTPSRTLPTFTFIDTRTTLWLVLRSLQQRKWPNLKWPASALMPQVTSYGTDVPDNNDCTTSLLCTIENNQQPRYNLYCGWRCVTGFYVSLCCSFRYLRNLFSLFFMT